jgi:Cdc6-like AAA superfamily ATPase
LSWKVLIITSQGIQETKDLTVLNQKGVEQMVQHLNEKDRLDLMKWISPIDTAAKQADKLKLRLNGTGRWFLETNEFVTWFNQDQDQKNWRTLFCPGAPGTGKTLMISAVIDQLHRRIRHDSTIRLAYFYCNYRERLTIEEILANILKQLIQGQMVPHRLKSLYDSHRKYESHLTLEEILELLELAISGFSKVFIIIDALDECQLPNSHQRVLLTQISGLQSIHTLGLLITSRDNPDISDMFHNFPHLRIAAKDMDIRELLKNSLRRLPRCVQQSPDLQEEIFAAVMNAADGM